MCVILYCNLCCTPSKMNVWRNEGEIMEKENKDLLLTLGGAAFLWWLLKKDKYQCPRCNYPVYKNQNRCLNCGQPLR